MSDQRFPKEKKVTQKWISKKIACVCVCVYVYACVVVLLAILLYQPANENVLEKLSFFEVVTAAKPF